MPNHSRGSSASEPPNRASASPESFYSLADIIQYISDDWNNLRRSLTDCTTYEDVKTSGEDALYIPADIEAPPVLAEVQKQCSVRAERLPAKITESAASAIRPHGLLYLPNPYIVPGGQFNEMYGWDSYFIIRGLLLDNRAEIARGMVENFFYEIDHYGGVLNANRTYYLGRSQPPFLSSMVLELYEVDKAAGRASLDWLERAYGFAVRDYEQWTRPPHLAGDTSLSRYYDEGDGPVPEILGDPENYYRGVAHYFLMHAGEDGRYVIEADTKHRPRAALGPVFDISLCDGESSHEDASKCDRSDHVFLSADYYKGDRSMRESGFDVSFRFGPYSAATHHFAPICLNSLLYKAEKDLEKMSTTLGQKREADQWAQKAIERQERINYYLWNGDRGLFFDYDFEDHKKSSYDYATTFYPLWVGLATKEQAQAVAANLHLFEHAGGLAMSRYNSQAQWDYPYGWAPVHLLAVEGLRRYGYESDANRISEKFLSMVLQNFRRDHTLREKYDVVNRSAVTHIVAGYSQNVTGFGWTNGVFLALLNRLPAESVARLEKE
jgi:alpha,alpha-trehalase